MIYAKNVGPAQFKLILGDKNLEKIVTVYGSGSLLGVDEITGLLNISPEEAQKYLDSLEGQGKAEIVQTASNKIKYKLV